VISTDAFANTFGAVPAGDTEKLVKLAVLAVRNGFALVLDKPGQKVPLCTLAAAQGKRADREAQEKARDAGDDNWGRRRHPCGIHHAFTDEAAVSRVMRRMIKNGITPNFGVEVGLSRMIVVDVDTRAERDAFLTAWTEAEGRDMTGMIPTVLSPGAKIEGRWVHKDGGHFWFTVPAGVELPEGGGVLRGEGGWATLWRGKQVLVPPSVRAEGSYRLVGQAMPAPEWLLAFITAGASTQAERRIAATLSARTKDSISAWAADVPWSEILTADDWTDTGKADNCGCPIWTAPGDHASPKSATAHEPGCSQWNTDGGQAPIHIWTDNIPECSREAVTALGRTFSKLNYLRFRLYDGDMARAKAELGIIDEAGGAFDRVDGPVAPAPVKKEIPVSSDEDDDPSDFGLPSGDKGAAGGGGGARPPGNPTVLPDEFWDSRPELRHIRLAARSRRVQPDSVFHVMLARLAATVPGTLKVDTEIMEPVSLNYFASLVAESGIGKSTSVKFAARLAPHMPGLDFVPEKPLGSGEGLSEAYMGNREETTGETYTSGPRQGEEKTRTVRAQTAFNALFNIDEGEMLAKLMAERSGATLGQQLRTAWTGGTLGQANGTAERTRIVQDYAMGLMIGYQPETAYYLLDGMIQGTPQRFVWGRVVDHNPPEIRPEYPGPLTVDFSEILVDPAIGGDPVLMTVSGSIAKELDELQMRRLLNKLTDEDKHFNSQRSATLIKIAGLLSVLAGRAKINDDDWELAKIVWRTSCKIRDILIGQQQQDAAKRAEERTERDVERAVAVAKSTGQLDAMIERVARNLVRWVRKDGAQKAGYFGRKIKADDRKHIPVALEFALEEDWLTKGDDDVLDLGTQAP